MKNITVSIRFKCDSVKQATHFIEEAKKELGDKTKMPLFDQGHIYEDGILISVHLVAEDISVDSGLTGS